MKRLICFAVFGVAMLVLPGHGVTAGCDDLTIDLQNYTTWCLPPMGPVDTASGWITNNGDSGYVCVWAEVRDGWNVETFQISVARTGEPCANLEGGGNRAQWEYDGWRTDWCDPALARIYISFPCTWDQGNEPGKHVWVSWTQLCCPGGS